MDCVLFTVALAVVTGFDQAPHIASSTPAQIGAHTSPAAEEFEIDGSGLIPLGSTFQTVPTDVGVWADDGTGWRQGQVIIPGNHGWGVGHLSIRTPDVRPAAPGLKIKVRVKGVDSNAFTVPVFNNPSPAPPKITSVNPQETILGSTDYYFVLQVHTNGQGGKLYFNGQQITQYVDARPSASDYYYQFSVPSALRTVPGSYPIQVTNSQGSSPQAYWVLVAPPTITSIAPAHLTAAQVALGAKPISVTVNFGGSTPKTISYAADAGNSWTKAAGVIVFGHQATFDIDAAALHPQQRITVKLANAAGEATQALGVKTALIKVATPVLIKK